VAELRKRIGFLIVAPRLRGGLATTAYVDDEGIVLAEFRRHDDRKGTSRMRESPFYWAGHFTDFGTFQGSLWPGHSRSTKWLPRRGIVQRAQAAENRTRIFCVCRRVGDWLVGQQSNTAAVGVRGIDCRSASGQ